LELGCFGLGRRRYNRLACCRSNYITAYAEEDLVQRRVHIYCGDAYEQLDKLGPNSIDCCFTSPDPVVSSDHMARLVSIFDKVKVVLKDRGSLWVQMGDTHDNSGSMMLLPERFVIIMKANGWIVRNKLIWHRPDTSPQEDFARCKRDWEYLFWFTKSMNYYHMAHLDIITTSVFRFLYEYPKPGVFESGFPEGLIGVAIRSTCPPKGLVLDPFCDSGTTGVVALKYGCKFIGIEKDEWKISKIIKRLRDI
jgi:site-specific DNA-methyltransferase (cytosine-N4-specific)